MKLRLLDKDGKLITWADAPDDLPLVPVVWNGDRFAPFGTREHDGGILIADYRCSPLLSPVERQRLQLSEPTRPAAVWHVTDANTPRATP